MMGMSRLTLAVVIDPAARAAVSHRTIRGNMVAFMVKLRDKRG